MIERLRQEFNRRYSAADYQRFLHLLEERCGTPVPFRNSETPCFLEAALLDRMDRCGKEILAQLLQNQDYLRAADVAVPEPFRTPGESPHPLFIQADFGLDKERNPMLVEIQGFPSLYAYQPALAEAYRDAYGLAPSLNPLLGDWNRDSYTSAVRDAILGPYPAENVILLEIEPYRQKTLPDFLLTQKLTGVSLVCVTEVEKEGRQLFYRREGQRIPIHRIYNRVVPDELERKNPPMNFSFREELAVEWADHPPWYFKLSKFSLPYLDHPAVPETHFLDRLDPLPPDLRDWVLKPLFSFAGLGVRVGPSLAEIEAIPSARRGDYILQRRVDFSPVVETPCGPTKIEVRIMYLWPRKAAEPLAMTALLRMGRGAQMGVDHNREMEWVGASAAFSEPRS